MFSFSMISLTDAIDYEMFDLAQYDTHLRGFYGITYHDGFVYLTPDHNGAPFGKFVRYDVKESFSDIDSWDIFDSSVLYKNAGYLGGGTDGKFLYFSSYNQNIILRYDTMKDFQDVASWDTYRTEAKFWGENSFDGRFVYFLPLHHTLLTRYDTNEDFSNKQNWQVCDLSTITDSNDFMGSSFDGRFLYIPSPTGKFILRYDTQKQFCNSTSWEKFNAMTITAKKGYFDAKFDGRFVYFSPYRNDGLAHGNVLRYDTTQDFNKSDSWMSFNPSSYGIENAKGYGMMTIVNDHLYLTPLVNWKGYHSNIMSYDINSDFNQIDSWHVSKIAFHDKSLKGYPSITNDGTSLYLSPYHNNVEKHGKIVKIPLTSSYKNTSN